MLWKERLRDEERICVCFTKISRIAAVKQDAIRNILSSYLTDSVISLQVLAKLNATVKSFTGDITVRGSHNT